MSKWKVLITAPYMQAEIERFTDFFQKNDIDIDVPEIEERMEEEDLLEIINKYDGVVAGDDRFTEKVMKKAKKLKVISKWGTGIDSFDKKAANKYGIKICNTPDAFSHPVADTVLGYMLGFSRSIFKSNEKMKKGEWAKVPGKTLEEQTLGIIGLGNIGSQVAKRAHAFGMKILGNDIKEIKSIIKEQYNIDIVSKEDIYKKSDFISLNCDLNDSSYHLLTIKEFKKMRNKPKIINTSRGQVIKEKDLIEALNSGYVSGAGLDVFENEPLPKDSPLRSMKNVITSSHNANTSPKYWEKVHWNTLDNLISVLRSKNHE